MAQQIEDTLVTVKGTQIGNYLLEKKIGEGQFGSVWKGRHNKTNKLYAIKKLSKEVIDNNPVL